MRALSIAPDDPELRLLAARVALGRLDYDEALRFLRGVPGNEAQGLRGRAYWYKGDLANAAHELEELLRDPEVKDGWAKAAAKLARKGEGREPFSMSGALLAPVEMPHVSPDAPYLVVPVEIDGESALALIATNYAEVVIDSAVRQEPSWVTMRFGGRLDVNDVPAVPEDLSAVSRMLNAPIRALIGVNLLRRIHATIDYAGHQFVARTFSPPPPPGGARIEPLYAKGSAIVVPAALGFEHARGALLVDTAVAWPLALDVQGFRKAGLEPARLKPLEQDPRRRMREGVLPSLKLGSLEIAEVPAVYGVPIDEVERTVAVDIDGLVGAGLVAQHRVTFADQGRTVYLEDESAAATDAQGAAAPALPGPPSPGTAPQGGAQPVMPRVTPIGPNR